MRASRARLIFDADERLIADFYCVNCGTPLRGQLFRSACPTCGHSISDSVHGDFLVDTDASVGRSLGAATQLLLIPFYAITALVAIGMLVTLINARVLLVTVVDLFQIGLAGAMLSPLIFVMGILSVTRRRRLPWYLARYGSRRYIWGAVAAGAAMVASLGLAVHYFPTITWNLMLVLWSAAPAVVFFHGLRRRMILVPNRALGLRCAALLMATILLAAASLTALHLQAGLRGNRDLETSLVTICTFTLLGEFGMAMAFYYLLRAAAAAFYSAAR